MTHRTDVAEPAPIERCSRRRLIAAGAVGLCSVALGSTRLYAQAPKGQAAKAKAIIAVSAIHQDVDFHASPRRIYEALLDAKQFRAFSGGRAAEIQRQAGGTFSLFDGHIVGRNLELVPDRRIVQAWRVVDWPEGVYSIARFELRSQGQDTRLVFDHTGFPSELAEHLESGWHQNYWDLLKKYLG